VGRFGGVFRDLPAAALASTVIGELVERTGLPSEQIDDVLLGQCYPNGEAPALGRVAALDAGLPVEVPGLQLDRRCETELYSIGLRWGARTGGAMLEDRLVRSHQRAVDGFDRGAFAEEVVPVRVNGSVVARDEHPRADASLERLAKLRPVMASSEPHATVTAGNASGQNDGAAVCIVTHAERAAELGLTPLARLVSWSVGGVPPKTMGIGPVPATAKALARADLSLDDIDLIEINEAFAAQVLAVMREWNLADGLERVNVNGSGISLGHPVGATGARILATLLRELRRRGGRYGLETMCIGGGQGLAAVFESIA
jgi:acetyl-CoA C-acetyltransferase